MSTNQIVPATSASLTLTGGQKTVRISKKDYFLSLPSDLGRSEKERRFAAYAESFSAQQAAGISGALAAGLVRITRVRLADSGRGGSVAFEVVNKTGRMSAKAKLEAEVAALRAELAAAKAALTTPAEAPVESNA